MRLLAVMLALLTSADVLASNPPTDPPPASAPSSANWRMECLGRTQFEVPGDIEWHVAGGHWNYPEFGIYSPNIDPSDKQLSYGSHPFQKTAYLFDIEVSPITTVEIFEQLKNRHGPDMEGAQTRVIEARISAIRKKLTAELEQRDPAQFSALQTQRYALDDRLKRLGKLHSETVLVADTIKSLNAQGRPVDALKKELEGYQQELATYPTDNQFEQERIVDWGLADAQITWKPGRLTAMLWRNQRVYRFTFSQDQSASATGDSLDILKPKALEVLTHFRARNQFEIPQETGFCVPFGFIADHGSENYAVTLAWHPVNNPDLLYSLSLSNNADKALKLLPLLSSRIFTNPFPGALEMNRFGPEAVAIGTLEGIMGGTRFRGIDVDTGNKESAERFSITAGHPLTEREPATVLKVESFANNQPLTFEQVRNQLLRTLKSIHALP